MPRTRLLLLDDHQLFREGMGRLLSSERDFHLVAQCATSAEALSALSRHAVDMVLVDHNCCGAKGFEFLRKARTAGYNGRMFIITDAITEADTVRALGFGVCAIFLKSRPHKRLTRAIRSVMAGETWIDESCIGALTQAVDRSGLRDQRRKLTDRECLVLNSASEGLSTREIAAALNLTEGSVKSALQQIFLKTGVHKRSQLVRVALEWSGVPSAVPRGPRHSEVVSRRDRK
jgi:DNA-binding NarL/FixJ family response regulator